MESRPSQDAVRSVLYDSLQTLSPLLIYSIHGISSISGRRAIRSLRLTPHTHTLSLSLSLHY